MDVLLRHPLHEMPLPSSALPTVLLPIGASPGLFPTTSSLPPQQQQPVPCPIDFPSSSPVCFLGRQYGTAHRDPPSPLRPYQTSLPDFPLPLPTPPSQQQPSYDPETTIDATINLSQEHPSQQQKQQATTLSIRHIPLSQREALAQAFRLTKETWAYDFVFNTKDSEVASLVMNPHSFLNSYYAEINVQAMDVGPNRNGGGFFDFQHSFNWLLVPGFNRDGKVAGALVSETVQDTENFRRNMPKNTLGRFIRDDVTSEMLIFMVVESGDAEVIWLKKTEPYRQERMYFRLKYKNSRLVSTEPDDVLFSAIYDERFTGCFKCNRLSGDCDCVMSKVLRRPATVMDFKAFQNNLQAHDGTWFGISLFYMKMEDGQAISHRSPTISTTQGFADSKRKRDMTVIVQRMWLGTLPMSRGVASGGGVPMVGWREPPEFTKTQKPIVKLRNSAAKMNRRRMRNLILKSSLKEFKALKPTLEERIRTLIEENEQLKAACVAAGKISISMHR